MSTPTLGYTIGGTASGTVTSPLPAASTIDPVNDYIPIYTNSLTATQAINRNTFLGLGSAPVGLTDSQTLTNKTLTSPTISSPTLSGTVAGTYVIGGTPTFPSSVVQLTSSQTLTNKTLTSPTINSPTITNATLSSDTITGYTTANSGTIYGISVTSGTIGSAALASNAVGTSALAAASVTPSKLATGAASATVATSQASATQTYGDILATAGPSVTVTIGANGLALVILTAQSTANAAGSSTLTSFVATQGGTTVVSASDTQAIQYVAYTTGGPAFQGSWATLLTGLTAGATIFKMQYRVSGNTGTWANRTITVIPL